MPQRLLLTVPFSLVLHPLPSLIKNCWNLPIGSVFGLEEEASRIEQGKAGVGNGYLVLDLVPALWEGSWCHVSQPPANNTGLSGSLLTLQVHLNIDTKLYALLLSARITT